MGRGFPRAHRDGFLLPVSTRDKLRRNGGWTSGGDGAGLPSRPRDGFLPSPVSTRTSFAGMAVGRRGEMGRGAPLRPRDGFLLPVSARTWFSRNDGWGVVVPAKAGTQRGELGGDLPRANQGWIPAFAGKHGSTVVLPSPTRIVAEPPPSNQGCDSCLRRNGCYKGVVRALRPKLTPERKGGPLIAPYIPFLPPYARSW